MHQNPRNDALEDALIHWASPLNSPYWSLRDDPMNPYPGLYADHFVGEDGVLIALDHDGEYPSDGDRLVHGVGWDDADESATLVVHWDRSADLFGVVRVDRQDVSSEGRDVFEVRVIVPSMDVDYVAHDLQSGCGGCTALQALCAAVSFLQRDGELERFSTDPVGQRDYLFDQGVAEFAYLAEDFLHVPHAIDCDSDHCDDAQCLHSAD